MIRYPLLFILALSIGTISLAQPCLNNWNLSVSTPPVNGTYACGQSVTFCITITGWNQTSANWFHGIEANFGPGWDLSTLVPGPPPSACSGFGTWGFYNSVQGTAFTNIGPQGPGFFFDQNNDGNPGNNFGDNCTGSVNWQFCWTISVLSGAACVNGTGLSVSFDTFGDSQTGSWGANACGSDPIVPGPPAVIGATCTLDAGNNGSLSLCSSSSASALFTSLGGTPDTGGTWTAPGGGASDGTFSPGSSVAGIYTYTVSSTSPPCTVSASVSVSVVQQPNAGTNGTITVCASGAPFSVLTVLGGSPNAGGVWTDANGGISSGIFDPALNGAALLTYTVPATAPCIAATATVQIDVIPVPNAGSSSSIALCASGTAISLINELGGSPSANGTWTAPDGSASGANFQPGTDDPGVYTYSVAGTAPCPASSATVNIEVNPVPSAGTNGSGIYCQGAPVVDLFSLLAGVPDLGGTWTNGSGAVVPSALDPQSAQSDTFVYTVSGQAPCPDASAAVQITIVPGATAGANGSITLCSTASPTSLFAELGGTPDVGGTWTGPGGAANNGTFQANIDQGGTYTYTVIGTAPCANSTATVTVTVIGQVLAGVNGTITLCEAGTPTPLLPILGSSAASNGTWSAPDGSSVTAILDPSSAQAGAYTYTVAGTAPCVAAQALVNVTINTQSNAGTNGTLSLCTDSDDVLLSTVLGGNPDTGGSWSGPSTLTAGTFSPSVSAPGVYTYSVLSSAPCTTATATVTISVSAQPDAGSNGAISLCSSSTVPFDLFSTLNGSPDPGGSWTGPNGQATTSAQLPVTALSGTHTYSLAVAAPCISVSSEVEITIVSPPEAGIGGAITLCENGTPVDPFTWLSGSFGIGGTWTAPDGTMIITVDPSNAIAGDHQYTIAGTAPCPAAQSTVNLTIDELPSAGQDAALSDCADAGASELFALLGSTADTGGSWSGPNGISSSSFSPGSSPEGSYTYTVSGTGACVGNTATAVVETTVFPLPEPSFTLSPERGCVPLSVAFTNTTPGPVQSTAWSFGDGGTSAAFEPDHSYTGIGTYSVTLSVSDQNGCTSDTTALEAVFVSGGPSALFTAGPLRVNLNSPTFDVTQNAVSDVTYEWSINGVPIQGGESFSYTFDPPTLGSYLVCLLATDSLGCANELCTSITVIDDITIHVPNAFTPDGDGINDLFAPALLSVSEEDYLFIVFDRWGAEVFSTNDPTKAWNGGYQNQGEALRTGVYVWRLQAKDPFSADRKEFIGSVTLLK